MQRYGDVTQHGVDGAIEVRSFQRDKEESQDWKRGSMGWHNDGGPQIPC